MSDEATACRNRIFRRKRSQKLLTFLNLADRPYERWT
jgi:hypothetical protein